MKSSTRHIILAAVFSALGATCPVMANPDHLTDNEWRIYDVNGDGKFDVADISEFTGNGGIDSSCPGKGTVPRIRRDLNHDRLDIYKTELEKAFSVPLIPFQAVPGEATPLPESE